MQALTWASPGTGTLTGISTLLRDWGCPRDQDSLQGRGRVGPECLLMPSCARSTCHLCPGTGGAHYLWGGALAPSTAPSITRVLNRNGGLCLLGGPGTWRQDTGRYWDVVGPWAVPA